MFQVKGNVTWTMVTYIYLQITAGKNLPSYIITLNGRVLILFVVFDDADKT